MIAMTKSTSPPPIEPCGNDDCDKCDRRPRWKVSQPRVQRLTHERTIKAVSEEEALRVYDAGLWRFFAPCREFLFRHVPKIFSQRSAEYFWTKDPVVVR